MRIVPLCDLRTHRPGRALRGAAFGARLWPPERGCACHLARVPGLTSASRSEVTGNIDARKRSHEAGGVRSALGVALPSRAWGAAPHGWEVHCDYVVTTVIIRLSFPLESWRRNSRLYWLIKMVEQWQEQHLPFLSS